MTCITLVSVESDLECDTDTAAERDMHLACAVRQCGTTFRGHDLCRDFSDVIADLHPAEDLAALHTLTRETTRTVLGDDACRYPFGLPHLTTATG